MRIRETGRFQAVDDQGARYTIAEITEFADTSTLDKPNQWEPVMRAYRLANGNPVNMHDDGTFEDVASGRKLRRL